MWLLTEHFPNIYKALVSLTQREHIVMYTGLALRGEDRRTKTLVSSSQVQGQPMLYETI